MHMSDELCLKHLKDTLQTVIMLQLGFQIPLLALQLCQTGVMLVLGILVLKRLHFTATLRLFCDRTGLSRSC